MDGAEHVRRRCDVHAVRYFSAGDWCECGDVCVLVVLRSDLLNGGKINLNLLHINSDNDLRFHFVVI